MKNITFDAHRQKHFDHFRKMSNPHFGITANVDITDFLDYVRNSPTLRFTPAIVYLIGRAAMETPSFRWRIRGAEVVEHDVLQPSFAVPTADSSAFSFCTVSWEENPVAFHRQAEDQMRRMKTDPSFEDEPGQDNYLYLSAFPWASFTSVTHAMDYVDGDCIPRITWGKYFRQEGKAMMPLAVQAHHALVDGSELGTYFRRIQHLLNDSDKIFTDFVKKYSKH